MTVHIVSAAALAWLSFQDIKERQICIAIPIVAGMILCTAQFLAGTATLLDMVGGAAVGGMLIFVSFLRPELLGTGDGIVFVMTGVASGFWGNLSLLLLASALAGIYVVILKIAFHKEGNFEFAFLPFVFVGYIICSFLQQ